MKDDTISRQAVLKLLYSLPPEEATTKALLIQSVKQMDAQPDEEKISDTLYRIYRNTSPHTSAEGVAAIKYYICEIYREIFGKEKPGWMR